MNETNMLKTWQPVFRLVEGNINDKKYFAVKVKFRYCEKATIFEKISPFFLITWYVTSKQSGIFFQICSALSEYLNFTYLYDSQLAQNPR